MSSRRSRNASAVRARRVRTAPRITASRMRYQSALRIRWRVVFAVGAWACARAAGTTGSGSGSASAGAGALAGAGAWVAGGQETDGWWSGARAALSSMTGADTAGSGGAVAPGPGVTLIGATGCRSAGCRSLSGIGVGAPLPLEPRAGLGGGAVCDLLGGLPVGVVVVVVDRLAAAGAGVGQVREAVV